MTVDHEANKTMELINIETAGQIASDLKSQGYVLGRIERDAICGIEIKVTMSRVAGQGYQRSTESVNLSNWDDVDLCGFWDDILAVVNRYSDELKKEMAYRLAEAVKPCET